MKVGLSERDYFLFAVLFLGKIVIASVLLQMSKVYIRKLTKCEKYESYKEITQPDLECFQQPRLMKGLNVNLLAFLSLLNGCPAMSHLLTAHCSQYID